MNDPRSRHGLLMSELEEAARLWVSGGNTVDIAEQLGVSEARVHNNMRHFMPMVATIRAQRRKEGLLP